LGAGRWGTTLAEIAARRGRAVLLYAPEGLAARIQAERANPEHLPMLTRLHDLVEATDDAAAVAGACHLLLVVASPARVRGLVQAIAPRVDGSHLLVHAVRGFEPGTLSAASRIFVEETCARKVGAFIGPALSAEVLAGRPCAAVVASRFPEVTGEVQDLFGHGSFRIYRTADVAGVEAAGVASGVIALAVGIALELGLGAATLALLCTRGPAEMARLTQMMGGQERTAFGLAGLGDLLLQREAESLEVRAGRALARGAARGDIERELGPVEAFDAARAFHELSRAREVEAPMTSAIHLVLEGGLTVSDALGRLMEREQRAE
jgi:glycerol-3-phosphate dehydrogenase (NAD(P)+)